ncbi:hypothetical protein C8R44DRAFT_871999 [Mycena epipterygia]|nr:hypothetical protein C8R44DRAFT_871999 [Mycena epipterygia]
MSTIRSMTPQRQAFSCSSILLAVYVSLPFADFMAMAQLTASSRSLARREFGNRATNVIGPILTGPGLAFKQWRACFDKLLVILVATQSILVGSTILTLLTLTGIDPVPVIDNLNIMAPSSSMPHWRRFLQQEMAFTYVGESSASSNLAATCVSVHVFNKRDLRITLTITRPRSMLRALLASNATSQMNLFTGTLVMSFFPDLTLRRQSLLSWPAVASDALTYEQLSEDGRREPLRGIVTYLASSVDLDRPCKRNCPRRLRQTQGLEEVGLFHWAKGAKEDVERFTQHRILWRIATFCDNAMCRE